MIATRSSTSTSPSLSTSAGHGAGGEGHGPQARITITRSSTSTSPELFTLPQALTRFVDTYSGPMWNVQLAAATMTAVPVLIVFVIAQRQFVEGLAQTGLKG